MCLQTTGNKNGKLWTTDEEVAPEVLAKVRDPHTCTVKYFTGLNNCINYSKNVTDFNYLAFLLATETKHVSFPVPAGSGHQAFSALVTRHEEQSVQIGELHPTSAVRHASERGRPHGAEEDQVSPFTLRHEAFWVVALHLTSVVIYSSFLFPHSKSDMSRLRLAAGAAIMKLAQEPCYHEIITPEQFQLCGLVINVSFTLDLMFCLGALSFNN